MTNIATQRAVNLSPAELRALAAQMEQEKKEAAAAKRAHTVAVKKVVTVLKKLLKESGVEFSEIQRIMNPRKTSGVVYIHPEDSSITWGGLGRKPAWVHAAEESGVELETRSA